MKITIKNTARYLNIIALLAFSHTAYSDQGIPTITSANFTEDIYENSGANQNIYTATSVADSTVSYSLINKLSSTQSALETPEYQSNSQMVYVSSSVLSEDSSKQTIVFSYLSDQTTYGVGIRIHFDSSLISPNDDTNILQEGLLSSYIDYDSSDLDNDPATDKFIQANWVSVFGGWPTQLDSELWTIEFDFLSNDNEYTTLNITHSTNQPGMDFIGHSHNIALRPSDNPLVIDSTTGVVTLIDNPDYEIQSRYNFSIIATDSTSNSSDALDLSLNILNIDDTAPIFNHPSPPGNGEPIEIIIDLNNTSNLDPGLPEAYIDDPFNPNQVHDVPENYYFLEWNPNFNNPYIYTDGYGSYLLFGEPDYSAFYTNYNDGSTQTFFWIDATDSDKDIISESLTYSLENNDDAISIDANSGAISFTLNQFLFPESNLTANTTEAFTVVVTDSAGNSQQQAFTLRLNDQKVPFFQLHCGSYQGVVSFYTYFFLGTMPEFTCSFEAYDASAISSISLTSNSYYYSDSWSDSISAHVDDGNNNFLDFFAHHNGDGYWFGDMFITANWGPNYEPDWDPMPDDIDLDFTITVTDTSGNSSSKAYDIFIPYREITPTVNIDCPMAINEMTASSYSDLGFDFGDSTTSHIRSYGAYVVCEIFPYFEFDGFYYDEVSGVFLGSSYNQNGEMFSAHILENPNYYNYTWEPEYRPTEPKHLIVFDKNSLNFESNSTINLGDFYIDNYYGYNNGYPYTEEFVLSINNMDEAAPIIVSSSTAVAIEENTGENQVIYTANADDSADISNGFVFSIKDLDNPNTSAVNIPNLDDSTEQIYIASSSKIGNQGERLAIKYASNNEWGHSFNLYFDSSKLNFNDFNYQGEYFDYLRDYFYDLENNPNNQQTISEIDDLDDADNDPATDSFISFVLNNQNTFVLDFDFVDSISDQSTVNILSNSELVASHSINLPTEAGNNFSSPLSIDANTGEVSLSVDPDYETKAEYNFAIIATDMAGNISNEHIVSLPILDDVTENPPVISSAPVVESIAENSGSNQLIYTATAEFSPQGTQSLSFGLADGSDSALTINSTSGEVRLNTNPDYEQQSQYNFSVIANDGLGNFSEALALSLSIENLDDTPPIFNHPLQPENGEPIEIIIDLNNTDDFDLAPGLIDSPIYDYSYHNKSHDVPENFYYLGYASGYVKPYVYTDGNGNYLRFGEPNYGTTKSNISSQTFFTARATDSDKDIISENLTYSLEDNDDAIRIDANSGAISFTLNSFLFPESTLTANSSQAFTVVVTDNAGNSQRQAFSLSLIDHQAPVVDLSCFEYPGIPTFYTYMYLYSDSFFCDFFAYDAAAISSISLTSNNGGFIESWSDDTGTYSTIENGDTTLNFYTNLPTNGSLGGVINLNNEMGIDNHLYSPFLYDESYYDLNDYPFFDFDFTITATDTSGNASNKSYDIFIPYRTIRPTVNVDCPSNVDEITASSHSDLGFEINDTTPTSNNYGDLGKRYFVCEIFAYYEFDGLYYDENAYVFGEIFFLDDSSSIGGGLYFHTSGDEIFFLDDPSLFSDEFLYDPNENYYYLDLWESNNMGPVFPDDSRYIGRAVENPNYEEYEANREPYSRPTEPKYLMVLDKNNLNFESNSVINFLSQMHTEVNYGISGAAYSHDVYTLSINNMDEAAPIIVSSSTATAIEENTGENQVIYNASADDSVDISNGIVYSIKDLDNPNTSAVNIPNLDDGIEQIYIASSSKIENQGERLAIKYASNDELGQSFNLYFDSSKLNFNDFNYQGEYFDYLRDYFYDLENNPNNIDQQTISKSDDLDDTDNDPATDSFISFVLNNQNTFVLDFDFVDSISDQSTVNILSNSELVASHSINLPTEAGNNFSSPLSIDANTGEVSLSVDPDYETKAEYNFAIIATDMAGNISNEHIVSLPILDDVTENPPVISSAPVVESIAENSGNNQLIYTATAEFSPQGTQSLSFGLADGSDSALTINPTSGEVRLNTNPDYEQQSQYNFSVIANDGLGNFSEALALSLSIENLDDTPPNISHELQPVTSDPIQITIDLNNLGTLNPGFPTAYIYPNMDNYASFDEVAYNNGSQQIFYAIDAADNTSDIISGDLSYSLGENTDPAISIDSATGDISFVLNAPSETESNLQVGSTLAFTAIVTDAAENSTSHQIELNLTDTKAPNVSLECLYAMDDIWHSYDFQMGHPLDCMLGVYDSSSISSVVFAVANSQSFDDSLDEGSSNQQSFITDSMELMFFSQPETAGKWTGDIHYHSLFLDPQTSDIYQEFSIIASDAAGNETQAEYSLEIPYVDFSPTFNASCPAIDENSGSEQIVCELSWYILVDDEYYPAPLMMLLSDEGLELIEDDVFDNDITTAKVVLNTDPDYEMQSEYMMEFEFINLMGLPISSYFLTLSINNVDEIAPTINLDATEVSVDENSGAGQILFTATADDSLDVSDGVSYSLSGADADLFSVNAAGEITLTGNPDYEGKSQYNLNVVAEDGAGGQSAAQALTLNITNLDEVAPTITSSDIAAAIDSNSGANQVVYIATAEDIGDISDGFTFDLSQDSDPELQIDPYTGEVVLTVNPNYESQSEYNFNIIATDTAGNSRGQYIALHILQEETIDSLFQSISVANEPQGIVGSTAKLEVVYEVSDENTQLPGIGFRVHFNSAVLNYIETKNIFTADLFVNAQGPFSDTEDFDNDATTDLYLSFGWASLFGNWPNTETPLNLFELSFDVSSDLNVQENSSTSINFTRTSNAEGYIFEPVNYDMNLLTASWDIDSNGTADALTDGLMLLRHAFGLRGESLTNGAVATDSPLTNAEVEQNMIDTLIIADIDDNGEVDALTDGLLLLRYLFNLKGDSLTKGSVSAQGLRTSNTEITDYLDRHMP